MAKSAKENKKKERTRLKNKYVFSISQWMVVSVDVWRDVPFVFFFGGSKGERNV